MSIEGLSSKSAWTEERVEAFLESYLAPMRVAVQNASGFPLLCSLWFRYSAGRILCATKRSALVVECIERDPRCAFELAPNEPPYLGVRGRGLAEIESQGAVELLGDLIDRYLGGRDSELARWLLRGAEHEEVVLSIGIEWATSWDYSERMSERTSERIEA